MKTNMPFWLCLFLSSVFFNGCYVYQPELEERQKALELVDQGVLELRRGALEEAEATFEVAYEMGHLAQALDGLGTVAFLRGQINKAELFYINAYNKGRYPNALGNLALLKETTGDLDSAFKLYSQALTEDPSNYKIRGNFSSFLADNMNERLATKELQKALAIAKAPLLRHNQDKVLSNSVNSKSEIPRRGEL